MTTVLVQLALGIKIESKKIRYRSFLFLSLHMYLYLNTHSKSAGLIHFISSGILHQILLVLIINWYGVIES